MRLFVPASQKVRAMPSDDMERLTQRRNGAGLTRRLELEPLPTAQTRGFKRRVVYPAYLAARRVAALAELLSFSISYIGEKLA